MITGAGSRGPGIGIGRAISVLFARQGAQVALVDKHPERAEETKRLVGSTMNHTPFVIAGDVSSEADCKRIVDEAIARMGRIDVLVNNVGIAGPQGTVVDLSIAEWDRGVRTNLTSMVMMSKHVVPIMALQQAGAVINISSIAGMLGGPSLFYPVSKGASVPLTRVMATQHGADGVRVNCIAPGLIHTPMVASTGMSTSTREARRKASALLTEGDAWDVAYAALFLASDEARWVTGVVLPVDGGLVASYGLPY